MTWLMVGTSMPRAATSVATSTLQVARAQARAARGCAGPAACRRAARRRGGPCSARRSASQSASRCVLVKTSACSTLRWVRMWSSSAFLCVQVVGPVQALLDVGVGVGVRGDVDALRIAQQRSAPGARRCRRRWRCTSRVWRAAGTWSAMVLDVVDEAHVEHAVGLVEHRASRRSSSIGLAGLQVVQQAAGRGDQDVERAAQRACSCAP
mgnify:CR=1 FL=1